MHTAFIVQPSVYEPFLMYLFSLRVCVATLNASYKLVEWFRKEQDWRVLYSNGEHKFFPQYSLHDFAYFIGHEVYLLLFCKDNHTTDLTLRSLKSAFCISLNIHHIEEG
jgi:hypothetical protein